MQPGRVFSLDPIIAEKVAIFLIRCLFTMFAASVKLLPERAFVDLLERHRGKANRVHHALERLWRDMDVGHYSTELASDLLHFNGGIFHNSSAIPLEEDELELLIVAARRDWKHVEPAIFGTLLERALSDSERSRLGAHYTPRPYVERLVIATIIDPLHEDWRVVQATAAKYQNDGLMDKAREVVGRFHKTLCELRILDPACGTGNFLYVAMELLKRLEGEVLDLLIKELHGEEPLKLTGHTIDPHQFLGLEINPRAVAIAELVLWIGHLQWHFRTHGNALPSEPVLRKFSNINRQDAILAHDGEELERDAAGKPLTRWDGVTYKTHPITGENIPDEDARVERKRYRRPRMAEWPEADFVVGNPPFIGGKDIRQELSDGYAEACWEIRPHIPGGADFVMHFWDKAADLLRLGKIRRFGLITTNSITQTFSRRVIERHMQGKHPLRLRMAIPDHPWVKGADRAAVRIAMTVADLGQENGLLREVIAETDLDTDTPLIALREREGRINADLSIGADTIAALPLKANEKLCSRGVSLHGAGFIVTPGQAQTLGLGKTKGLDRIIVPYRNGRDLTARPRDVMVIDAFGLSDDELRKAYPSVYQWLSDHVRPERDHNNRASYRDSWWTFGEPRRELRTALQGLKRYIATVETAKHRVFQFLDGTVRPDNRLVCFALEDAFYLGVLSSHIHVKWTLHVGGLLEDRPIYTKTLCFDPFPFPTTNAAQRQQIGAIAEQIDNHRKTVLARHKHLTLTGLYNVLEQVKAGAELSAAEQDIYQAGLVGVLRDLHIDLDRAVAAAYGWPTTLSSEAILERLVALNRARAEEERSGLVHWLRPDFQSDGAALPRGLQLEVPLAAAAERKPKLPDELPDRVRVVRDYLRQREQAVSVGELARAFSQGGRAKGTLEDILLTLTMLGQADRMGDRYRLTNWR